MSTTPAPLTPAELAALDIALRRESIAASTRNAAAVEAQTAALVSMRTEAAASREATTQLMQVMLARPTGVSEEFFKTILSLVVGAMAQKPAA